jgi:hypothetical protein
MNLAKSIFVRLLRASAGGGIVARMFEDFSVMVQDNELREQSIAVTERTQGLLDAIWKAGLEHEAKVRRG